MSESAYEQLFQTISTSTLTEVERNSLKILLDNFNDQNQFFIPSFMVNVNYDQTIEQYIEDGDFDCKNEDITSSNFASNEKGQVNILVYLVIFTRNVNTEDALKELDRQNFRPASIKELLSLNTQYPELQNWIVALGSTWRSSSGHVFAPYSHTYESFHSLDHIRLDGYWDSDWQFAAVRK